MSLDNTSLIQDLHKEKEHLSLENIIYSLYTQIQFTPLITSHVQTLY